MRWCCSWGCGDGDWGLKVWVHNTCTCSYIDFFWYRYRCSRNCMHWGKPGILLTRTHMIELWYVARIHSVIVVPASFNHGQRRGISTSGS